MIDHVSLPVRDLGRSRHFYARVLAPLGFKPTDLPVSDTHAGFGYPGKPQFWIGRASELAGSLHVAFVADNRDAVNRFHSEALLAGGTDNGSPGLRAEYHANYYAAFALDPDGHNIEAVCHFPGRFEDQFVLEKGKTGGASRDHRS